MWARICQERDKIRISSLASVATANNSRLGSTFGSILNPFVNPRPWVGNLYGYRKHRYHWKTRQEQLDRRRRRRRRRFHLSKDAFNSRHSQNQYKFGILHNHWLVARVMSVITTFWIDRVSNSSLLFDVCVHKREFHRRLFPGKTKGRASAG